MSAPSGDFTKYGGSYLLSNQQYETYVVDHEYIGRPDGQFMIPSNQMDELLQNYPNDPREWERQLGLNENSLGDENIHRVDVYHPQDYEPRMPTPDLSGSNEKFLEGTGKTPGGQDECVSNPFPNPEYHPEVGKITTTNSESVDNAPNTIRGNTDNPPEPKKPSRERGQAPLQETNNTPTKEPIERGHLPEEATAQIDAAKTAAAEAQKVAEEAAQKAAERQTSAVTSTAGMGM